MAAESGDCIYLLLSKNRDVFGGAYTDRATAEHLRDLYNSKHPKYYYVKEVVL